MSLGTIRAENGGEYIDDTAEHTGSWCLMKAITDCTIAAITQPDFTNTSAIVGATIYAGDVLYGEITAITLTSGIAQMVKY